MPGRPGWNPYRAFHGLSSPVLKRVLAAVVVVAIAVGFGRGRLKSVYQVLRGKDVDTGEFSTERRESQFGVLQEAQAHTLNLTSWHQFLSALIGAGFRGGGGPI